MNSRRRRATDITIVAVGMDGRAGGWGGGKYDVLRELEINNSRGDIPSQA